MQNKKVDIAPSVMCADLCNLEAGVKEISDLGIELLHVDILDGHFSPSMPLGIDTIKQLKTRTNMKFDVHIMSKNNEYFIQEMIDLDVHQISFHIETSDHVDRHVQLIKQSGIKTAVALNPATPLTELEYILPLCDTVVLMLINPGFATNKNEKQVPYAVQKVKDLKKMIDEKGLQTQIEVDGRVSFDTIPELVHAGADILVAGSTSLFSSKQSLSENKKEMEEQIKKGLFEEVK
ncbi:ribulose-phosphate 3-epimerase [Paenalkalicoccus suaedae]|uniref:Ribulose-phosphate 3-epimerase n=1 Tax=Paenalkalicoccus suaedae TaxID=2592382 RepID=A0A859FHL7_9BACI|nr:ribulose-phosphate 3-epimerase [Paenalkalicoccus suaedae]QKS72571.1 ribulose-phosphate 3-epimerase [Paenalkalicoccus suaedae]